MPNSATTRLRNLARWLLAYEAAAAKPPAKEPAVFHVCEKLRRSLSQLAGVAGFRSILSRALALAGGEAHWLKSVHVKADGSLEGLDEARTKVNQERFVEGEIILIAQLIGLLVTFIGEGLTLRLLQESWPDATFTDMNS